MTPPPEFQWGPGFFRDWLNRLRAYAISIRPIETETCLIDETEDGSRILPRAPGAAGGVIAGLQPLQVIDASDEEAWKVRVVKGQVAGHNQPFEAGDEPPLILEVVDGDKVFVKLSVAYAAETGWVATDLFAVLAGASVPAAAVDFAYYEIKDVAIDEADVMSLGGGVGGNISWRRCGNATVYLDDWGAGP